MSLPPDLSRQRIHASVVDFEAVEPAPPVNSDGDNPTDGKESDDEVAKRAKGVVQPTTKFNGCAVRWNCVTITLVSAVVASAVGGIEALGLVAELRYAARLDSDAASAALRIRAGRRSNVSRSKELPMGAMVDGSFAS